MGLFGPSSKKLHLSSRELRKLLDRVPGLDNKEEEHVLQLLQRYRSGGISKSELEEAVRKLQYDRDDPIGRDEAEKIQAELLKGLEEK